MTAALGRTTDRAIAKAKIAASVIAKTLAIFLLVLRRVGVEIVDILVSFDFKLVRELRLSRFLSSLSQERVYILSMTSQFSIDEK
jgi:hypothetical protein